VLYGTPSARRRDAQRNRAAILEAASEVLTAGETVALMPEIARRAGVGQATLYRHFADRQALIAAVITFQLERLEEQVAAHDGRPEEFRALLREVLHTQIAMRGLISLVRRLDQATQDRYRRRAVTAVAVPMRHARDRGYVRADLVPEDLALLFAMVQGVAEGTDDVAAARAAADRAVDLMLDGVFRHSASTGDQSGGGTAARPSAGGLIGCGELGPAPNSSTGRSASAPGSGDDPAGDGETGGASRATSRGGSR
jgi:AcrR family transcriptional regulator